MPFNQLTEEEQVLVSAFRNLHPERKQFTLNTVIRGAMDNVKHGPKLVLVSNNLAPSAVNQVSRRTGRIKNM